MQISRRLGRSQGLTPTLLIAYLTSTGASFFFWNTVFITERSRRESWFTQSDVDTLTEYGINTVRIPVCHAVIWAYMV